MPSTDQRALAFYRATTSGTSRRQLQQKHQVSKQYITQMVARGRCVADDLASGNPARELATATRNALTHHLKRDPTPASVRTIPADVLARIPCLGVGRIAEIKEWLNRHKD